MLIISTFCHLITINCAGFYLTTLRKRAAEKNFLSTFDRIFYHRRVGLIVCTASQKHDGSRQNT